MMRFGNINYNTTGLKVVTEETHAFQIKHIKIVHSLCKNGYSSEKNEIKVVPAKFPDKREREANTLLVVRIKLLITITCYPTNYESQFPLSENSLKNK